MQTNLLKKHKKTIHKIAVNHGVRSIQVFGSFARGDENIDSDIDLLVELEPNRSFLVPYSRNTAIKNKKLRNVF